MLDRCVVGCLWPLQLFPGGFWIEISPDVFLKGTVGEGGYLFSVEHRRYFLYPHPKGIPYPSMLWNLHGRNIVAHKTEQAKQSIHCQKIRNGSSLTLKLPYNHIFQKIRRIFFKCLIIFEIAKF